MLELQLTIGRLSVLWWWLRPVSLCAHYGGPKARGDDLGLQGTRNVPAVPIFRGGLCFRTHAASFGFLDGFPIAPLPAGFPLAPWEWLDGGGAGLGCFGTSGGRA